MLSDTFITIFQWVILSIVCQAIVVFGIVTNIINIICFVKLGFQDPVNVSFLGLAISDLGCLVTLILLNICYTPAFHAADLPFDSVELAYMAAGIPHTAFTRVTAWLTALIILERCLCITAPFKVKSIVTRNRLSGAIAVIFIVLLFSIAPVYVVNTLQRKFSLDRNKTLLVLVFSENREIVERISFAINNAFIPFSAFVVIIVCTIVLVTHLHKTTKWRLKSTMSAQALNISIRNQKLAKMVVMISALFIVCFIFVSITFIAMATHPALSLDGTYRNVLILLGGTGFCLESINSSANIFIYYHMSSSYRVVFDKLFHRNSAKEIAI